MTKAAVYIDLDNMLGYCYSLQYPFAPEKIKKKLEDFYSFSEVEAKAYGNIKTAISHLDGFLTESEVCKTLEDAGVKYVPSEGKKNSADLMLSLEALQDKDGYHTAVIVSSDADFNPLVEKLKGEGKEVLLIKMFGPKGFDATKEPTPTILYRWCLIDGMSCWERPDKDSTIISYRNTLEYRLKMPLPTRKRISKVFIAAEYSFCEGINLSALAEKIPDKDAFKILRASLFGGGFTSDRKNKYVLRTMETRAEDYFYRRCKQIVRQANQGIVDTDALYRVFI